MLSVPEGRPGKGGRKNEPGVGDLFPQWKGNLFVDGMAAHALVRLVLNGNRIAAEEHLLTGRNYRIRDIQQAPDGSIYLLAGDALLHVTAK